MTTLARRLPRIALGCRQIRGYHLIDAKDDITHVETPTVEFQHSDARGPTQSLLVSWYSLIHNFDAAMIIMPAC